MPSPFLSTLLLVLLAGLAGCTTTIHPEDYDASCNVAVDCLVIVSGDVCSCSCEVAAINVSDEAKFLEDRGSPSCSAQCGPCPAFEAVCADKVCKVKSP